MGQGPHTSNLDPDVVEFRLISVDGTANQFRGSSAAAFFLNAPFLKFFVIAIVLVAVLRGPSYTNGLYGWPNITFWVYISFALLGWFICAATVIRWALNRRLITTVYTPIITILGAVAAETASILLSIFVFDVPELSGDNMPLQLGREFIAILLFDALFGHFIAPSHPMHVNTSARRQRSDPRPQSASTPSAPVERDTAEDLPKVIGIGSHTVAHDDIRVVQIEDHSLNVRLRNEQLKVRGKFNDIVQELDPNFGLEINRSAWIARPALQRATRSRDYKLTLFLDDGTEFVVARSRWAAALEKLELWHIPIRVAD